ncbi:MAG TPA: DinB family protein [Longimicrobiales bacterium]|jgi:uncharacterized damage-inducible protein DinB
MSVFTNPASGAADQGAAYTRAVLDLVEGRDPFEVLRSTADELRDGIAGMSDSETATPEAHGKWSVRQLLRHLADTEIVWAWRMRLALTQDRPPLTGFDQDAWAERLRYDLDDVGESLADFALLRGGNLRILDRTTPDDLKRVAVHVERGDESVEHMINMYAGHDLLHLRQLARIRAAVAGRG